MPLVAALQTAAATAATSATDVLNALRVVRVENVLDVVLVLWWAHVANRIASRESDPKTRQRTRTSVQQLLVHAHLTTLALTAFTWSWLDVETYWSASVPTSSMHRLYVAYLAAYAYDLFELVTASHRERDYWRMIAHHIVTLALVAASLHIGYVQIGCVIMLCCEPGDVLLHGAKLTKPHSDRVGTTLFVLFIVSWVTQRLYWFSWNIVALNLIWRDVAAATLPFVHRLVFKALLCTLAAIMVAWTVEIVVAVRRRVRDGELEDVRHRE